MRRLLLLSLLLAACTSAAPGTQTAASSSAGSVSSRSAQTSSSSSSSVDPKAPKVYLQWQDKKLPALIKGNPRRRLSLYVSGAVRQVVYVGTFNGTQFDLQGEYVSATGAYLKASISWNGSGDEIWADRDPNDPTKLLVHYRDVDEKRPYLTVNRIGATVDIPANATVLPRLR